MTDESRVSKTVEMTVSVTVTAPRGKTLTDEDAKRLAMSAVTQRYEVEFGRDEGNGFNRIAWAEVYAEVSEEDCEVNK